jgi:hypothetical protein
VTEPTNAQGQVPLRLSILGLQFDPHRLIYSTIILIAALSIYDEGTGRIDARTAVVLSAVIIAPLFALTMAHAFSDALDLQIKLGRRLTGPDRRHVLRSNLEYMYIAVPPLALTLILGPTEIPGETIIDIILGLGLVSLFMWGVFAARKARLSTWTQIRFGINYAVMGIIIVIVELILTH